MIDVVKRQSIIVFFTHLKKINLIKKIGDIKYVSKNMHYLVLYVNQEDVNDALRRLRNFGFVKSAYASPRAELRIDYNDEYLTEEDEK